MTEHYAFNSVSLSILLVYIDSLPFSYTTKLAIGSSNLTVGVSMAMAVTILLGVLLTTFNVVVIYCFIKGQYVSFKYTKAVPVSVNTVLLYI